MSVLHTLRGFQLYTRTYYNKPNQTKPNQTKPNQTKPSQAYHTIPQGKVPYLTCRLPSQAIRTLPTWCTLVLLPYLSSFFFFVFFSFLVFLEKTTYTTPETRYFPETHPIHSMHSIPTRKQKKDTIVLFRQLVTYEQPNISSETYPLQ